MRKQAILIIALILFSGCTTRLGDFTVISTKTIDWSRSNTLKKAKVRVDGEDIAHWIIFLPTGSPTIDEAVDNAIESIPGAVALIDAALYSRFWWIPYIYGQQGYIIEGTPLIDTSLTSIEDYNSVFRISYIGENNEMITRVVSEEEFNEIRKKNNLN